MAKKLQYFDVNGLIEPVRYILHYGKEEFEDIRYKFGSWPIQSVKDSLPYGQLPLYQEGDRILNQSLAIARYVGSLHGLVPSDPWEQALLDAIVLTIEDFRKKVIEFVLEKDESKKELFKKQILEVTHDYFFSRFEKELEKNNGYFGGKLSWADFIFIGMLESSNMFLKVELEENYPLAAALVNNIRSLPGVKEYIAQRKPYTWPIIYD